MYITANSGAVSWSKESCPDDLPHSNLLALPFYHSLLDTPPGGWRTRTTLPTSSVLSPFPTGGTRGSGSPNSLFFVSSWGTRGLFGDGDPVSGGRKMVDLVLFCLTALMLNNNRWTKDVTASAPWLLAYFDSNLVRSTCAVHSVIDVG